MVYTMDNKKTSAEPGNRMAKATLWLVLLLVIIWCVAWPILRNGYLYRMNPLEALLQPFGDGTEWAKGYSFRKFQSIQPGMTTNDVLKILGPPMAVTKAIDEMHWHYTIGCDGGVMSLSRWDTHVRFIVFGSNGVVRRRHIEYYYD